MKNYLLMLTACMAMLSLVSCQEPGCTGGGGMPDEMPEVKFVKATYDIRGPNAERGIYSLTLSCGKEKIQIEMIGVASAEFKHAKLPYGTYTMSPLEEFEPRTYFVATESTLPRGTLFWNDGTLVSVSGGEISVSGSASGYRIALDLVAGGKRIDWVYTGKIGFECSLEVEPNKPDPIFKL